MTTGIVIWDDAFLYDDENTGEKIAIIVIDTQGLYRNDMPAIDNQKFLSLAALISSSLILNISGEIENGHLEDLNFAVKLNKFATLNNQNNSAKYFKYLMLIVRNWVSKLQDKPKSRKIRIF